MPDRIPADERNSALFDYAKAGAARRGFWRVLATLILLALAMLVVAAAVVAAALLWSVIATPGRPLSRSDDLMLLLSDSGPVGLAVNLGAIALIWPALWLALKALHRQRLRTLFAPEGRIRWREFWRGAWVISAVLVAVSVLSLPGGDLPERSELGLGAWLLLLGPVAVLVFFQATAEELVFRGYLLQQLALRARNPLVWAGIPSFLFSLLHYNATLPETERYLYVLATFLFGLVAAATVARTGSLATAMGMHVATNVLAITLVAPRGLFDGAALFIQHGGTSVTDLLTNIAAMLALLIWTLSPLSPFGPRRTGSAEFA